VNNALSKYKEQGDHTDFYPVVEELLVNYYDPMYDYQIKKKISLQLLSGDVMHQDCLVPLSRGEILACQAKPLSDIKIGIRDF
jgi:hypothetical protein